MKSHSNDPPQGETRTRGVMILQHAIWYLGGRPGVKLLRYTLQSFGMSGHCDWRDWLGYGEDAQ